MFDVALTAAVLADPGLSAIVGDRAWWKRRPKGTPAPCLVMTLTSAPWDYTSEGRQGLVGRQVQFDGYSLDATQDAALADALRAFLDRLAGGGFDSAFIENERFDAVAGDGPQSRDGPTDLHRTSLDVRVWHAEP